MQHKALIWHRKSKFGCESVARLAAVPVELNSVWPTTTCSNINRLHAVERDQINWDSHPGESCSLFVPRTVLFCPFYGVPPASMRGQVPTSAITVPRCFCASFGHAFTRLR
jgi:hypothetical protein